MRRQTGRQISRQTDINCGINDTMIDTDQQHLFRTRISRGRKKI